MFTVQQSFLRASDSQPSAYLSLDVVNVNIQRDLIGYVLFSPGSWLARSEPNDWSRSSSAQTAATLSTRASLTKVTQIQERKKIPRSSGAAAPLAQTSRPGLSLLRRIGPHTPWHFPPSDLYVCGKMLHCFTLALWLRTHRGRRAPGFTLLRINCSDRALRGPSLGLCPLRSKEAVLILSVSQSGDTDLIIIPFSFCSLLLCGV